MGKWLLIFSFLISTQVAHAMDFSGVEIREVPIPPVGRYSRARVAEIDRIAERGCRGLGPEYRFGGRVEDHSSNPPRASALCVRDLPRTISKHRSVSDVVAQPLERLKRQQQRCRVKR